MNSYSFIRKYTLLFLLGILPTIAGWNNCSAQNRLYTPEKTRILFLLDGSGSMNESWDGTTKFDLARSLIIKTIDSLEQSKPDVEFGLRIFGHQSPKSLHDCKDSKLEVPFGSNNAAAVRSALSLVQPKGYTPIAYSLFLGANDFRGVSMATNVIILITDGVENCEGDPCASSEALRNQRVSLKPFIIGLGIPEGEKNQFDCVGIYYDARNSVVFNNVLNVVVSQALNNTTAQINLLDYFGKATETGAEMTLYDSYSGSIRYNLVHARKSKTIPDTIYLDPSGKYDLMVHTIPPVMRKNIELTPGKHNVIAVDVPQGLLNLRVEGTSGLNNIQCIIRKQDNPEILYVQNFNTLQKYLVGKYDLEILSIPRQVIKGVEILSSSEKEVSIPKPGSLSVYAESPGILSIYSTKNPMLEKVYELRDFDGRVVLRLQPGEYVIVFRSNEKKEAEYTLEGKIEVYEGKNSNFRF